MISVKERYINEFSKKLICSKRTRLKLSNGLKEELSAYTDLSYEELCEQIGTPDEVASQMMEDINQSEIKKVKQIRFMPFLLITLLLIVLIGFLGVYYVHTKSVMRGDFYVKEEIVKTETVKISDGMLE